MKKEIKKKAFLKNIFYCFFFIFIFFFYSYRLTRVPPGINIDESSFGYNGSLLAKNLRDENNRRWPVFILTLGGKDWKPPARMYETALVFKVFGRSYFNFRAVSVLTAVVSGFLFFKILRLFMEEKFSFIGVLLFITSPSMLLQSHLGLDNIDVLPWSLLWLYFILLYYKKPKSLSLVLSGIFLGISFYVYKAMHAIVPAYLGLSAVFLLWFNLKKKIGRKHDLLWFILGILPFLLPLNWLQTHYAGSIYDPSIVNRPSFYDGVYTYLSSFDFSFLFLRGDKMLVHSTGHHGIFLLPCLPLFLLGLVQLAKEKKPPFYFIFACMLVTPLFFPLVGSVYRASRLMMLIPLATFVFTLGVKRLYEIPKKEARNGLLAIVFVLITLNYGDFVRYYWYEYPKTVAGDFSPNIDKAMAELKILSVEKNLKPYFESTTYQTHKADMQFFKEVYFPYQEVNIWTREAGAFPEKALVLTAIGGSGDIVDYREIPSLETGQRTLYIIGK